MSAADNTSTTLLGTDLTVFPRIQAPYSYEAVPGSEAASKECLTLSWAILLHGYVSGDIVSFIVDGDAVSVDFSTGVVESSPADNKLTGGKGSAVYYSKMVCRLDSLRAPVIKVSDYLFSPPRQRYYH